LTNINGFLLLDALVVFEKSDTQLLTLLRSNSWFSPDTSDDIVAASLANATDNPQRQAMKVAKRRVGVMKGQWLTLMFGSEDKDTVRFPSKLGGSFFPDVSDDVIAFQQLDSIKAWRDRLLGVMPAPEEVRLSLE
jgi:hypothetical protein